MKPDIDSALRKDRFLEPHWLLAFLRGEDAIISDLTEVTTQPAAGEITTTSVDGKTEL